MKKFIFCSMLISAFLLFSCNEKNKNQSATTQDGGISDTAVFNEENFSKRDLGLLDEANKYKCIVETKKYFESKKTFEISYTFINSSDNKQKLCTFNFDVEKKGKEYNLSFSDKNKVDESQDWYLDVYQKVISKMDSADFYSLSGKYFNVYAMFKDIYYANLDDFKIQEKAAKSSTTTAKTTTKTEKKEESVGTQDGGIFDVPTSSVNSKLSKADIEILNAANQYNCIINYRKYFESKKLYEVSYTFINSKTKKTKNLTLYFDVSEYDGEYDLVFSDKNNVDGSYDWYLSAYQKVIMKMDPADFHSLSNDYFNVYSMFENIYYTAVLDDVKVQESVKNSSSTQENKITPIEPQTKKGLSTGDAK